MHTISRADGATLAYAALAGRSPGVVFLHGFRSDKNGDKALALEAWCRRRGQAFVRFDTFGHGESSGRFEDGTIGRWADDAVHVLDALTEGPQVLVGSSMGAWLMLLAARRRPERVAGLVGIAAAPDFTERIWTALSGAQRKELLGTGRVLIPSDYGEPYPITRALIEEARAHLLLEEAIPVGCPVRLLHGLRDADVPWETSLQLQQRLTSEDVQLTLVKDGDHRLSRPQDLALLGTVLEGVLGG
jgi:pimeloyl-ACP methyl ester carboxylesterase